MYQSTSALALLVASCCAISVPISVIEIQGYHEDPNHEFVRGASYRLVGDTKFGWKTADIGGEIDLNGHAFVMDTGGGNRTVFNGAITGEGTVEWIGGAVPQVAPSTLDGAHANRFHGSFTLSKGVLDLAKPAGVNAIPGDLIIGKAGAATIRLASSYELDSAATVTLGGPEISAIELMGHDEKIGPLNVRAQAEIDMGDAAAMFSAADSSRQPWDTTKTLTFRHFKPGKDRIQFGQDFRGLAGGQLARIGFADPAGKPHGLYTARILEDGRLVPDRAVKAISPPFDLSPPAAAAREALYHIDGLSRISGPRSPITNGTVIDFFGDSITWLNGYMDAISSALHNGTGTRQLRDLKLINHGINGGGVLQIRDGATEAGYPGNSPQKPFSQLIAEDRPGVAVLFIGINDVWWRKTSKEQFEKGLRDIVSAAAANHTRLVMATMELHGELPDGKNADDARIEQYCSITRKVALDTQTTLVDLRRACIAYLQNSNAQLRVDGTLYFRSSGLLTYDGVHPSSAGVSLLANLLSDGLCRALAANP